MTGGRGGSESYMGERGREGGREATRPTSLPSASASRSSGKVASNHNLTGASAVRRLVKNVSVVCGGVSSLGGFGLNYDRPWIRLTHPPNPTHIDSIKVTHERRTK